MAGKMILKHWSYGFGVFFALLFGYVLFPHIQSYAIGMILSIENTKPIIHHSAITLSDSPYAEDIRPIQLIGGERAPYKAVAQISDGNGFGDIFYAEAVFYRAGVEAGKDCVADERNCYRGSTADGICTLVADSARHGRVVCDFAFAYFADPTIGEFLNLEAEDWILSWKITDYSGEMTESDAYRNDIATLLHLDVPESVQYGALALGQSSYVHTGIPIRNLGNVPAQLQVFGDPLICERGIIPANHQRIDVRPGDFLDMEKSQTMLTLSETEQLYPWLVIPVFNEETNGVATLYTAIEVPTFGIYGECKGGISLMAQ